MNTHFVCRVVPTLQPNTRAHTYTHARAEDNYTTYTDTHTHVYTQKVYVTGACRTSWGTYITILMPVPVKSSETSRILNSRARDEGVDRYKSIICFSGSQQYSIYHQLVSHSQTIYWSPEIESYGPL